MQEADLVARGSAGNPAPPLDDIDRFDGLVTEFCPVSATVIVAGTTVISVLVNTARRCQRCVSGSWVSRKKGHAMRSDPPSLFEIDDSSRPLADRLRPTSLADVVGQDRLLSPGGPIGRMVAEHRLVSMILWGPPGCGKTTIARLLAEATGLAFEPLSATFSGVADLRQVFAAPSRRREVGRTWAGLAHV